MVSSCNFTGNFSLQFLSPAQNKPELKGPKTTKITKNSKKNLYAFYLNLRELRVLRGGKLFVCGIENLILKSQFAHSISEAFEKGSILFKFKESDDFYRRHTWLYVED